MVVILRAVTLAAILVVAGWLRPFSSEAQRADRDSGSAFEAADSVRAVYRATRIPPARRAPVVDGVLDDRVWSGAVVADRFAQTEPDPGSPASERTEVRLLYHDRALYVGVRLFDARPDSIMSPLARRDEDVPSDWFYVALDSDYDRRTAFVFGVNPRGVKRDLLLYDDIREDVSWNPVWDAAVSVDSLGWTAEIRIPLSQLRFSGARDAEEELVWGLNFERRVGRREEVAHWSPIPSGGRQLVSVFGELRGLEDLRPPRRLELRPYTVARLTRTPGSSADPFYRTNQLFGATGADLLVGVTSNLTLTATINPDFGQIEADPSVVNTTGYRTFFPEKRPFFLEGAQLFEYRIGDARLFHSRRIGREPQRIPDVEESAFVSVPEASSILGAAKLTGTTPGGWSIGALAAVTGEESARIADSLGVIRTEPVEPLTSSAVVRVTKDSGRGRGTVGGVLTATNRRLQGELDFLPAAAYAGGLDLRQRFASGNYEISGSLLGSHVEGSVEAIDRLQLAQGRFLQRPDAPHLSYDPGRTSLTGMAATAELARVGRGNWTWGIGGHALTPEFEVNDLGFQRGTDVARQHTYLGFERTRSRAPLRRIGVQTNQWSEWTFGRERLESGASLDGRIQLRNFWGASGGVARNLESLDPDALRGGPALLLPASTQLWLTVHSDRRRPVSGQVMGRLTKVDEGGGQIFVLRPLVRGRPSRLLELTLQPSLTRHMGTLGYVGQRSVDGEMHYLLGDVNQTTVAVTSRFDYTLTPTFSIQLYAQPYLMTRSFSNFKEAIAPRATGYDDRFLSFTPEQLSYNPDRGRYSVDLDGDGRPDLGFNDPNFRFSEFRSNLVLRWEYRRGSTFYLVFSRERTERVRGAETDFGQELSRIVGLQDLRLIPTTNVFLIKVDYWLGR